MRANHVTSEIKDDAMRLDPTAEQHAAWAAKQKRMRQKSLARFKSPWVRLPIAWAVGVVSFLVLGPLVILLSAFAAAWVEAGTAAHRFPWGAVWRSMTDTRRL